MRRLSSCLLALFVATTAVAQQPTTTVQQDFEAATALSDAGTDLPAALAAWEKLERRVMQSRRNLAIVRLRKSAVMMALQLKDEAMAIARQGLAAVPINDPSLTSDRFIGLSVIAAASEAALDYATAADAYRQAESIASDRKNRLAMLRGLIATGSFVDQTAAAADLARAETLLDEVEMTKDGKAVFSILKAELLLNQGNFSGARKAAGLAVSQLGGLTERLDLQDVTARSDYAIAAALAGDSETAHQYLAYSGAGHLPKGDFNPGAQMTLPECGGDLKLNPQDAAVIEFTVDLDGVVRDSRPVYAAGGGQAGLAFAREAREWSFRPEEVAAMPRFFRYNARVELRCSTALARPGVTVIADQALREWLSTKGFEFNNDDMTPDAGKLPRQRAQLAGIEAKPDADIATHIGLLAAVMNNAVTPTPERQSLAVQAVALARSAGMPALGVLALDLPGWSSVAKGRDGRREPIVRAQAALADPFYAADPQASAVIRLLLADAVRDNKVSDPLPLVQQVADDTALDNQHPLHVAALVRLASLNLGRHDAVKAKAAFDASGLTGEQCALTDSPPLRLGSNEIFPNEALRWGFEGWTQVQFDISADGKVLNERSVIAYPPLVFTDGARQIVASTRYTKSYRPAGGLACGGNSSMIKFIIRQ